MPVVAYVNTSAEVKAEVDICCTSSNAVQVVESLNAPTVIFLPDRYLATYVASKTDVKIIAWKGACEVHERFTGEELRAYRDADPSVQIIAHPECPPDVLAEADFTGSTAHMINWVRERRPRRLVMITECSMADNVRAELPDVEMLRPCNLCPHMKRITLANILDSLLTLGEEVTIDPALAERARRSVERMINLKNCAIADNGAEPGRAGRLQQGALNTKDAAQRAQAMEIFLAWYPNSVLAIDAYEQTMAAWQSAGNPAKADKHGDKIAADRSGQHARPCQSRLCRAHPADVG